MGFPSAWAAAGPVVWRSLAALPVLALIGLAAGSCKDVDGAQLALLAVQPASAPPRETAIRILGRGFAPWVTANFDDEARSRVSAAFSVRLGDVALRAVEYRSATELAAVVPAGLAAGAHALAVTDPRGREATLAGAFRVEGAGGDGGADGGPPRDGFADGLPPRDGTPDGLAGDATPGDATPGDLWAADGAACPASCVNGCADGACELECSAGCACPAGFACRVVCGTTGACQGPIDCSLASRCDLKCGGNSSCAGVIQCSSGGDCTIVCSGTDSCGEPITCGAGFCDVRCHGLRSCAQGVSCALSCGCATDAPTVTCPPACAAGCGLASACDTCP